MGDLRQLIQHLLSQFQPQGKNLNTYVQDDWEKLDVPFNGVPNGLPFNDTDQLPSLFDIMMQRYPGFMGQYNRESNYLQKAPPVESGDTLNRLIMEHLNRNSRNQLLNPPML